MECENYNLFVKFLINFDLSITEVTQVSFGFWFEAENKKIVITRGKKLLDLFNYWILILWECFVSF